MNEIKIIPNSHAILYVTSSIYGDQECLIDVEDVPKVSKYRWTVKFCGKDLYYAHAHIGTTTISLHRLVMGFPDRGLVVDHIDGNCLDCRKSNLRIVSYSNNRRNSVKQRNTKCQYRGVYERNDYPGKYRAQIRFDGRIINLGTFTDILEAARAYDTAARKHYGEFAVTNFST